MENVYLKRKREMNENGVHFNYILIQLKDKLNVKNTICKPNKYFLQISTSNWSTFLNPSN